ncbi:unnamed protein product [Paramecium sonneborni]|uniref:WD domain, G-beta repeat protein n=1 Tax=Paramecium sonneborni TaxID=65129 RepID=A0A8S1N9Y0_9CILI|nr:unnamed protein product [Paramecium sonneborni]
MSPFNYQLLPEMTLKYQDFCKAIAINFDNSIVLLSAGTKINIFYFKEGYLKLLQKLRKHSNYVHTLNMFRNNQNFISSASDSQIFIWNINLNQNSKYLIKLKEHSQSVNCLLIRQPQEDLIISGSSDKSIKFWSQNSTSTKTWSCFQTINKHTSDIFGMSINEEGNRLLSCANDKTILITECQMNGLWCIKQRIDVKISGGRVTFIKNELFVFLPNISPDGETFEGSEQIELYRLNQCSQQYIKCNTIPIKGGDNDCTPCFPQLYNNSKQILICKNGEYVNFLQFDVFHSLEYQCKFQFAINFFSNRTFGTLSQDGQYFITWCYKTEQIQIRKFKN